MSRNCNFRAGDSARPKVAFDPANKQGSEFTNVHSAMNKTFTTVHPPARQATENMNASFTNVQDCSQLFIKSRNVQNEPTDAPADPPPRQSGPPRGLSYAQLAAARLIVQGHRQVRIARHLAIAPQTLCRWKREPRFAAEVERLRGGIVTAPAAASASPPPAASRPTPPARAMTRAEIAREDREVEAMVEQIFRSKHPNTNADADADANRS